MPTGSGIINAFDSGARLLESRLTNSASAILNLHQSTYDAASQRTTQTNVALNYWSFEYDSVGQLKGAKGHDGATNRWHEQIIYGYDPAGNLIRRTNYALVEVFTTNTIKSAP